MDEIPSHRACASCRTQKVRCIPDESNPDVCQRCVRSGRPCVFTPLQKRKQRKRTDTRVAELEKEMRAMRSMLKQKEDGTRSSSSETTTSRHPAGLWFKDRNLEGSRLGTAGQPGNDEAENADATATSVVSDQNDVSTPDRFANSGPYLWPKRFPDGPKQDTKDVVDSGMLSMATARQLFETYKNELYPHYPLVYIAPSVTADDLRYTKPALFLAIIAAASGKENADLSAALDKEVLQSYATRSLVQSQKSLELVQALLISAVW
ncbi:Transcription factor himD [Pseudocercospora fuligena]|uniref:Transcription factor himD n=1 Tax=Pseudocercospora fuligena TaxID=685502 RepID=A0A8H6RD00_9PEZI|nr:Transcription factor himD [Pseudocercospora fuligena]